MYWCSKSRHFCNQMNVSFLVGTRSNLLAVCKYTFIMYWCRHFWNSWWERKSDLVLKWVAAQSVMDSKDEWRTLGIQQRRLFCNLEKPVSEKTLQNEDEEKKYKLSDNQKPEEQRSWGFCTEQVVAQQHQSVANVLPVLEKGYVPVYQVRWHSPSTLAIINWNVFAMKMGKKWWTV